MADTDIFAGKASLAEPESTSSPDPFAGKATAVEENPFGSKASASIDPFAGKAAPATSVPEAEDINKKLSDPNYAPSEGELRALYTHSKTQPFVGKAVEFGKSLAGGLVSTAKHIPGVIGGAVKDTADAATQYIKDTVNPVVDTAMGVRSPAAGAQAELKAPVNLAKKGISTAVEGTARAVEGMAVPAAQVVGNIAKTAADVGADDETKYQNWKTQWGLNRAASNLLTQGVDDKGNIAPQPVRDVLGAPAPNISELTGLVGDPVVAASLGTALAKGATRAVIEKSFGAKVASAVFDKAAGVTEKAGQLTQSAAGLPRAALEKLGEPGKAAADILEAQNRVGVVAQPYMLNPAAHIEGVNKAGQALEGVGSAARNLAEKSAVDTQQSALEKFAKDNAQNPTFRRIAAALDSTVTPASRGATTLATGAAKGAGISGGLAAAAGETPEATGQATGSGAVLGTGAEGVAHFATSKVRNEGRENNSIQQFLDRNQNNIDPNVAKKVDRDTLLKAATLYEAFGGGLHFKILDDASFKKAAFDLGGTPMQSAGGLFDKNTKTVYVNADDAKAAQSYFRDNLLHEAGHGLYYSESFAPDRQAFNRKLDTVFGPQVLTKIGDEYSKKILEAAGHTDVTPEMIQQFKEAQSQLHGEDWVHSEIFAEMFNQSMFNANIRQDILAPGLLNTAARTLQRFGIQMAPDGSGRLAEPPGKIFEGADVTPELKQMIRGYLRSRDKFISGVSTAKEKPELIPVKEMAANPATPLVPNAQTGVPENEFVRQGPDGRLHEKKKSEIRQAIDARAREVLSALKTAEPRQPGDTSGVLAPHRTPDGKTIINGTKLPAWFNQLSSYNELQKGTANLMEQGMANPEGPTFMMAYQPAYLNKGNLAVTYREYKPFTFTVSAPGKAKTEGGIRDTGGNFLVTSLDVTTAMRKALQWQEAGKLQAWSGNVRDFMNDVHTYLGNHAAGLPGEANNIGGTKKNIINSFFGQGTVGNRDLNPLREGIKSKEDKDSMIRAFRLDRMSNVQPTGKGGWQYDYDKVDVNMRPGQATNAPVTETPEFKKWFGNGAIKDEAGNPKPMFHGTQAGDISEFHPQSDQVGVHFGSADQANARLTDKSQFDEHGHEQENEQGQQLYPTYLNLKNPIRMSDTNAWDYASTLHNLIQEGKLKLSPSEITSVHSADDFHKLLESKGYDGIVYRNKFEMNQQHKDELEKLMRVPGGKGYKEDAQKIWNKYIADHPELDSYIAFHPEQVKSATGNSGAFDETNPSILMRPKVKNLEEYEKNFKKYGVRTNSGKALLRQGFKLAIHRGGDSVTGNQVYDNEIYVTKDGHEVAKLIYDLYPDDKTAHVGEIYTNPDYRRQGIAETMYRELAAEAQTHGITAIGGNVVGRAPLEARKKLFGKPAEIESDTETNIAYSKAKKLLAETSEDIPDENQVDSLHVSSNLSPNIMFRPKVSPNATITWEQTPSRNVPGGEAVINAPADQKAEYSQAIQDAITNPKTGKTLVDRLVGHVPAKTYNTAGTYVDSQNIFQNNPLTNQEISTPRTRIPVISPEAHDKLALRAAVLGLITQQDAVPFHRVFPAPNAKSASTIDVVPERVNWQPGQLEQIVRGTQSAFGSDAFFVASTDRGLRFVCLNGENTKFADAVKMAMKSAGANNLTYVRSAIDKGTLDGSNYISNDWIQHPNGQQYRDLITQKGGPALLRTVDAIILPRVYNVNRAFNEKYGWNLKDQAPAATSNVSAVQPETTSSSNRPL